MDGDVISPGRRRNAGVTDDAIERIRELVASGAWGPGTRLPREVDLAKQLGLSRNSLREAVRALSQARVLEVRQGDGTYVSSLDPGELLEPTLSATHLLQGRTVLELFEVRRMLEPEAAALAAQRADEDVAVALRAELDRMVAAGDSADDLVEATDRRGPERQPPELDQSSRGTSSAGSRCSRSQFSFVAMWSSAEARARSASPAAIAS